jgi:hypothetical protein
MQGMMGMGGMMGMQGMMMGMQGFGGGMMGCHPGCFPAGTLVLTTEDPRPIEEIKAGEYVLGVDKNGNTGAAKVRFAFVTENYVVEIETDSGLLTTTGKQPLCTSCGCSKTAFQLKPGEELLRWENGKVRPTKVLSVKQTHQLVKVFNLVLEDMDYYICGGFQVRSKPPLAVQPAEIVSLEIAALPPAGPSRR